MKVLLFDDELQEKQALFKLPELTLLFYPHADDVVAAVRQQQPDLVLMDYYMQARCSGTDAIVALRQHQLPVRIVAISSDRDANRRMLAVGADDAVPKTHLRAYLMRWLESVQRARQVRTLASDS
jgi:CheY-like chemotaxis protein